MVWEVTAHEAIFSNHLSAVASDAVEVVYEVGTCVRVDVVVAGDV